MKINKIFISGLALLALSSCNDYLDVEPASNAATPSAVYGTEAEVNKALNGVYAKILTDKTFGGNLYNTFQLNSDVDFYANSNEAAAGNQPRRFDVRSDASNVEQLWNDLYNGVETANEFIYNLKNSSVFIEETESQTITDKDGNNSFIEVPKPNSFTQMMGEAKVIRAMIFHELMSYWGDVPFTFVPTFVSDNFTPAIVKRQTISDELIADLMHAAEYMNSDKNLNDAPRRISKEAAYAMIARLALQAGGYSLNHDENNTTAYKMTRPANYKEYYEIAREYAKKVIDAGGHTLTQSYQDMFVNECNYIKVIGDDPIFEIPFVTGSTGNWGYAQGPTNSVDTSDPNWTNSAWGEANGGVRTTYFYRFGFDKNDQRRNYTCGLWYYSNKGVPTIRLDYAMHNNKWSKLWQTTGLGASTTGATGISFAYIRYADVLLMYAEAENEINEGPTANAIKAVEEVRNRAFGGVDYSLTADAKSSKKKFLKAVLDERKWEFAGENMRWKDLVRNNMYSEAILYTFLAYYSVAEAQNGASQYLPQVILHDGIDYDQKCVSSYEYVLTTNISKLKPEFPNNSLYMMYIVDPFGDGETRSGNPYQYLPTVFGEAYTSSIPTTSDFITSAKVTAENKIAWSSGELSWVNNDGTLKNQINYSLFGYIRADESKNIYVVRDGAVVPLSLDPSETEAAIESNISSLPAVRYLLPYPEEAIARSSGAYKNYYGF